MFLEVIKLILSGAILVVAVYYTWLFYKLKPLWGIVKGPTLYPIVGNAHLFPNPTSVLKQFDKLRKIYGGIFTVILGTELTVVISDYKYMESAHKSMKLINKSNSYRHFHNWLGLGLLTSGGIKWKQRRKVITPAYHFSILEKFLPVFDSVSNVLVKVLKQEVGSSTCVDIYPYVTLCTLDIICETAMGCSVDAQQNKDSEYVRAVKGICNIVLEKVFSPLQHYEKTYKYTENCQKEKKLLRILNDFTMNIIKKKQNDGEYESTEEENPKKVAFLDLLLKSEIDGVKFSDEDLREEVATFMFEGHDTTASAISFALFCIAENPEVHEKLYKEQVDIFGNDKDCTSTLKELNQMRYLDLVIKETLRLFPSVPFYARQTVEDTLIGDVVIPKNYTVTLLTYAIQRDEQYFEEPNMFRPERFLPENYTGKFPYSYTPFSAGPRNCIGQKFAQLEMKATISKVLRNFALGKAQPAHKLDLICETILKSSNGIKVQLTCRE